MAEINRDRKKRSQAYTPQDFMPESNRKKKPKTITTEEAIKFIKQNRQ